MENYITLFDSKYLPQGLALHASLLRYGGQFTLWILCIDEQCFQALSKFSLQNVRLLKLASLESEKLLQAKRDRTIGEYCWTLTPFTFQFVFDMDANVDRVTYIDSDIWFRKSPSIIMDEFELSEKKVLITDHGYAPEYDQSATSGQYCVQFLTFKRDGANEILNEWQTQCLQWCFNRHEDGKFGDQKYLDQWPNKYPNLVHVLSREYLTLAPWNASRFPYGNSVLWHFHALKLYKNIDSSLMHINLCEGYPLLDVVKKHVYLPYLRDLANAIKLIELHEGAQ